MFVCMYVCVIYINFLFLDSTLDFLRPGDFASNSQTYTVNEGGTITFAMDTYAKDCYEETSFRVCHHDSSPKNQSVSCCDCYNSKECEWGILEISSLPQPICLVMTSQPGLYQFEIYTSHFPCYQNIGGPIKISKINTALPSEHLINWLMVCSITSVCAIGICLMSIIIIKARKKCKAKDSTY